MTKKRLLTSLTGTLSLMFLWISTGAQAQEAGATSPLFGEHSVVNVRIEAPLKTLLKERPEEDYLEGIFVYSEAEGGERQFDLKIRTRGRFRRKNSTCPFPPVRLNFRKGQVEESLLAGQDKLKLVTHCNTKRNNYEQLVLREYLAYRILHTLTDASFGARLMHIDWVDTEGGDTITRYGFVIEDDDDISVRLGMEKVKTPGLAYQALNQPHTNLMVVFQYLIGNTDFSLIRGPADDDCCHNAVPYSSPERIYSIPYDLDFSGLVNAPYADPAPQFKIRNVTTRVYRGRCANNGILPDTLNHVISKKGEIYGLVDELTGLDDKNRSAVTKYLDSFFDVIEDPKKTDRELIRECS
jgi:hypothetical protein